MRSTKLAFTARPPYIFPCIAENETLCENRGVYVELFEHILAHTQYNSLNYTELSRKNGGTVKAITNAILSDEFDGSPNVLFLSSVARRLNYSTGRAIDFSFPLDDYKSFVFVPRISPRFSHELLGALNFHFVALILLLIIAKFSSKTSRFWQILLLFTPCAVFFVAHLIRAEVKLFGAKARIFKPAFGTLDQVYKGIIRGNVQIAVTTGSYRWLHHSSPAGKMIAEAAAERNGVLLMRFQEDCMKAVHDSAARIVAGERSPLVVTTQIETAMQTLSCEELQYIDRFLFGRSPTLHYVFRSRSGIARRFNNVLKKAANSGCIEDFYENLLPKNEREQRCKGKAKLAKQATMNFADISGLLYGLLLAHMCSSICLFVTIVWSRRRKSISQE